jgi:hypothetical protein
MMKAESVSRGLVPNELPLERQESAGKGDEDFRTLLEAKSMMATKSSAVQEPLFDSFCSSGCTDSSSFGAVNSGKATAVYGRNAVLYQPDQTQTVPAELETGPSITVRNARPSSFETEKTFVQPGNESPSASGATGGLSNILSEIKGFFGRLFSPQSSSAPIEPVDREDVSETGSTGSNGSVTRFFQWFGTLLTLGLWRPEGGEESGKTSKDAVTKASEGASGSAEGDSLTSASSRQKLPTEAGGPAGSRPGGMIRNTDLQVPPKIREAIEEAACKYDLSADLIAAIIKVESNFDPGALSREGAGGLMQLMPSTAKSLKVANRFDIRQNIDAGSRYLKSLLERFGGQVDLALAAYNVGPDAVERYDGIPPYRQTRHYVKKVLAYC